VTTRSPAFTPVNTVFADNVSLRNFAPRLGIAFDPAGDRRTHYLFSLFVFFRADTVGAAGLSAGAGEHRRKDAQRRALGKGARQANTGRMASNIVLRFFIFFVLLRLLAFRELSLKEQLWFCSQ